MDYKTPGVFVEEVNLFPPSVAPVATAIPAFIGHTARVVDENGDSLINKPIRLTSLLEFTNMFGGAYNPPSYTVGVNPAAGFSIVGVTPVDNKRYYLFDALRHYFDNGGGPCYVVTVGDYDDDVIYGTSTTGLSAGLKAIERVDEPTLLVAPDSVEFKTAADLPDFAQIGNLHKDMINQCARLQDRFAILDLMEGYKAPATGGPIDQFRNNTGVQDLKYSAAYYPWLSSTYPKNISFSQLIFVDNQSPPVAIPNATINTISGNPTLDALITVLRSRSTEETNIFSKVTAVALDRNNFNPLSAHLDSLRAAVMAATTAAVARPAFSALMTFVRELALSFIDVENDAATTAEMDALLTSLKADADLRTQLTTLIAFEKNTDVMNSIASGRTIAQVHNDYTLLNTADWINSATLVSILANPDDFDNGGANTVAETAQAAANSPVLQTAFDTISDAFISMAGDAMYRTDQAEKNLFAQHPFFKAVIERIRRDMSLQPPSGAVAGVYAAVDRSRGVWKAPANVSLRAVITPAYKLTDLEQGDLNIHETGKSINAIRAFTGKGILIWGARTLAGNDNEWRYVNVRRFFNFAEESTKKASLPFVFESNDANTWIRIRAMIENFLTIQWRQGALAGSSTKEAFYVKVGLGETMTAQDILEGRLIVEIGMAVVRPAEFIILRFTHKMQES